ncbi:hypothetical protein EF27_23305 [Salmonella enterica]|uniref:Phosphoribulokinase n=3 Tax=Salmonella enterica TaxID=28901 RepID=A0A5X9MRB2_SALTM|nr:hypothetical protein [Salmonella enterica subsp. enterica serovar Bareilly]EAM9332355.1 hypothetical protein [Salmonella enterica]EBF6680410.1 hypothetical protein [Salmonella enterica subsp. enterica serovar Typhimurium]EBH8152345.1 hypothetical protein [Salmonella enterica subsp. enterica serovar Bareilly str. CFSAN000189]EBR0327051.1 hypothetical protein [Salmonella enterica subsp. enterica serovar Newport]EBY6773031.1 hypothetical protein [Salmonella enterica subsp. enterica serovar Ric
MGYGVQFCYNVVSYDVQRTTYNVQRTTYDQTYSYRLKDMVEQFDAKPAEIRALFNNQLDPARTAELRDRMLAVGLPI